MISEDSVVEVRGWVDDISAFASVVVNSTSVVGWVTVVVSGVFGSNVVVSSWMVDDATFSLFVVGGDRVVEGAWVVVDVSSCCLVVGFGLDVVLRVVWNLVGVIVDVSSIFSVVVEGAAELVSLLFATKIKRW